MYEVIIKGVMVALFWHVVRVPRGASATLGLGSCSTLTRTYLPKIELRQTNEALIPQRSEHFADIGQCSLPLLASCPCSVVSLYDIFAEVRS